MSNDNFTSFYGVWTAPRDYDPTTLRPMRKTYTSIDKAYEAAKKLSKRYNGKKFFVLEAVGRVQVFDTPTEDETYE